LKIFHFFFLKFEKSKRNIKIVIFCDKQICMFCFRKAKKTKKQKGVALAPFWHDYVNLYFTQAKV